MSKYTKGLLAVILAVVLVLPAAAFAMLPEANARSSTGMDGPTKIVDHDTSNHWKFWAGGYNGKEITTQNVGRIWTDKTVRAVENGDSDFLTTLSAISSTSDTTVSGKPLDIVLVLDASGSMNDSMGGGDSTERIVALKRAANSFIDTIATQNEKIADAGKQHQVAIVKFAGKKKSDGVGNDTYREGRYTYNYSQTMQELTACSGNDAKSLKGTINSIAPAGATHADYGLQLAEGISSNRADAQKIVVFFTDGSPTSSGGFEPEVARDAINTAKTIKSGGATIYTIGIFSGAKPSDNPTNDDTSNANKFMHAVSSNYPSASSSVSYGLFGTVDWSVNFGDSVADASYYKSATSASELEKIFEEISGSIIQTGYPTEVHGGYGEHKTGYITFTDKLGDFMQVDNFTSVVYNGETFTNPAIKPEGNVDTYKFIGAAANLVITVQHAGKGEPQTGDIVTVKIPASLIPLRHFKITDGVLTVDNTEPIQVSYTSSVKKEALDNLFTPENLTGLEGYIKSNTTTAENGSKTVNFYANKWKNGALGDTIANFEPADSNRYYYFQKQTPIYVDESCTTPATGSLAAEGIYYYKDEFEAKGADGRAESRAAVIEFTGGHAAQFEGAIVSDASGNLSFSEGTARLAFIDELHTTKERVGGNPTDTATDVLNPKWNNTSAKSNATEVDVHLGNNGKISYKYDMTPTTVDTKASFGLTKVLEGREWTGTDAFEFELSATSENSAPMPKSTTVVATEGNKAIDFGKITYAEPGTYVYKVSEKNAGQTIDGIKYSDNVAKITVTVTPNKKGELSAVVKVTSGEAEFENIYATESAKSSVTDEIKVTKVLDGRDLKAGEFSFELREIKGEDSKLIETVKNDASGKVTFSPIKYTEIGQHTYTLREVKGNAGGITYDETVYTIVTTISDNKKGQLVATHELQGAEDVKNIEFKNAYNLTPKSSSVTDQIIAKKVLDGRDLKAGEFRFELVEGNDVVARGTNAADGKITMDKITYTEAGEHTYTLREVKGDAGGITYSTATYTIVTTVTDNGDGTLDVHHVLKDAKAAEFKNSYGLTPESSSVTDQIVATKSLDGRDLKDGEFSFELVEGDKVVARGTNAADGTIVMDKITYDKPGNHTYTLREKLPNEAGLSNGITYDKTNYTIKTSVIDNGDGALKVTHALEGTKPARFENKYNTAPNESSVTDQIIAKKVLDGRGLKAGEFRFELVEGNNVVATGANNADGKIVMDPVTYTEAGEHTYMLRETKDGAIENGITYSTAEYTIVTIVKDNGDGTLNVEHKLQNDEKATFENAYNVTPKDSSVTDKITATKVLDGRDLKEGEFSFELVEGEDAKVVATGTNAADGKITMSEITYNEPGKHTYKLREVPGDANNGITYDGKTYTIETTVTDNGKGELVVKHELKGADEAKFNNSYKPKPNEFSVTDQITATKVLTGRDLKAGEFSFLLVEGEGEAAKVVATGNNAADGTITMSPVKYDKAGTHTYTLREVNGGTTSKGITFDDKTYTIVTTITDKGDGTLEAKHELKGPEDAESIKFENTYSVTPLETKVDFGLSKAIDGRDWTDGDEFSFTISAAEGTDAPLPDPATVTVGESDANDEGIAAISFGKIRFTAAGTYKYEIRENAGSAAGMTYDGHVATAEVTVTENGEGKLTANVTKKENGRFTNTYRTELDYAAAGGLKLSKTLSGRPMTEGQFSFTVTPADEASANALGLLPGANTFKSPATAEATVGLIDVLAGHEVKFTQADAGKTFTYTVAEKNDGQPGYTYDEAVRTVTIAIADDGAGTLTATTTVSGGSDSPLTTEYKTGASAVESAVVPFRNSYSASTDSPGTPAKVVATKKLTGRPMANGEFYFGIAYAGETEAIDGTCVTNFNGQVSFGWLHYDTEMLANLVSAGRAIRTDADGKLTWTISYTAFEYTNLLADQGITAAKPSFSFKVTVVDNGDGTLTATPDYGGTEPVFENVYGAEAVDAALAGTKKLQADKGLTPADIAGKFTFTVAADEDGAPMPELTTATNDAAGNVDFGKIHFTLEDLNRALGVTANASGDASSDAEANADKAEVDADASGDETKDESKPEAPAAPRSHTFTYTVTESGSAPGVTNDANTARKVSYTVTDDRAGRLSVVRNGDDGAAFTFTNTYSVTPTDSVVTDQVKTVKRLTGRDLAAGEFTFELLEDGVVVASGTNDANGNVTLSPIRYEAPGTHTYTLREACPNALGLYKGVTYDSATYTIVTTVTDNGDGTLTATHKLEGTTESAGFTNKYHAMPTQVSIGAIKVLEGRELKKDEFSFKLVGEGIESTVTNDADGKINFDKFEYDEPGTYVYTISEVKGDEAGMTYDKSVFTATVNVVDDGEGNLKANVAFTKGDKSVEGIVFNNTYKKPETPVPTPDPGTPKTVTNIVKTVKGFLPTTGDQQAAALLMAFVIAMAGVGALVWGIRKR
ncbi:Spy0128 family protein [Collinsella sp. AF38-3AC]|uniref:Spy0128 family protein n=1 Tax=Collinsella sp. AF38-3AC TaxID=2292015 RepID=UPI000E534E41|nr:FctA domain-containing protein [Collinsella sp. AF38-3AC]RHL26587.1 VWA domain-containing protein [Collinsella sp. AF38-3AC]